MLDNKLKISDKDLYTIAVMRYKKEHPDMTAFPKKWIESNNYKLKTEIIAEAIRNHILIEKTELYKKVFMS